MSPTDIPVINRPKAANHPKATRTGLSYHRSSKETSGRGGPSKEASGEHFAMRVLAGAGLFAIPLFVYGLWSFPNPLQPAFTTTEALLAVVLLGLVIGLA